MNVVFDAATAEHFFASNGGTINISAGNTLPIGSGANRAVVFMISNSDSGATVTSVTWDSGGTNQAASFIPGTASSHAGIGTMHSELWGLVAPASGNLALQVVLSGASTDAYVSAVSFTNVNQTGGATSFPNGTAGGIDAPSSSTPTLTVASASTDATVSAWMSGNITWTTLSDTGGGTAHTIFADSSSGSRSSAASGYTDAGGSSVVLTMGGGTGNWQGSACDVAAPTGELLGSQPLMMMRKMIGWRKTLAGILVPDRPAWSF